MKKDTVIIGFMLFALFFGAGNLIYPPTLGIESGTSYWAAIAGFIITGVGLPILAVMAVSFVKNDARELGDRVHPLFGLIFTSMVYLTIGPVFAIPRAATVAFEMAVEPFITGTGILLFLFTTIFFVLVYLASLNPSKMVDRIGQYLTPILLAAIVILCIGGFMMMTAAAGAPADKYTDSPLFSGFVEGYLTMDAIAALAFGIIIVNAFKERGVTTQKGLIQSTLKAGLVAGISLTAVYTSIGWIGSRMASAGDFSNGGAILSAAAETMFGSFGALLLGVIVALACYTTSVGLVVACGQFFHRVTGLSYKWIIAIVTLISYLVANQGLNTIINVSVPVLTFIYPIAIVLIIMTFLHKWFGGSRRVYQGAILVTGVVALYDGLAAFGLKMPAVTSVMEYLPFFSIGLGWIVPAVVGGLIGYLFRGRSGLPHSN
ncbi:branched-chain amino acid transport system II carrier protein [Lentibacillus sp. CBA3610]|uniref:branched-chain amino acid transport system II carrier protein n=1 Tax=Lentibacillus sp. CBA3610 TaxID=2518176 RepID=UPI001595BF84|nr:branched-chain amino acid transport system II carrier protein [Lentibacillus sp. CBA3610]QKY70539.1 branched-chain amino acid transport system II carrier protein [Lentibacillus sp. CBA3610]